jgi:hypothetical protein
MHTHSPNDNGKAVTILPPTPTTTIDGRSLAHRQLSKRQRACVAANIFDGWLRLNPTQRQVADMCGVSLSYVRYALALSPDARVPANVRPPRHVSAKTVNGTVSTVTDDDLVKAIRIIGVNRVLDAAIAAEAAE